MQCTIKFTWKTWSPQEKTNFGKAKLPKAPKASGESSKGDVNHAESRKSTDEVVDISEDIECSETTKEYQMITKSSKGNAKYDASRTSTDEVVDLCVDSEFSEATKKHQMIELNYASRSVGNRQRNWKPKEVIEVLDHCNGLPEKMYK